MGQTKVKRRTFDAFARQRILDKLDYIQRLHPRLSQEEIAAQIQELTKATFDRKYLLRLRKGTLSDASVNNVVAWISARHDPNFLETLRLDEQHFSQASISKHTVLSRKEWLPVSREETKTLAPVIAAALGLPDGYCDMSTVEFRAASFIPKTRVLRSKFVRRGALFSEPTYLLERAGVVRAVTCSADVRALEPVLDAYTLIDIVAFHFECIDASAEYHLLASLADLIYYLHQQRELPFHDAANDAHDRLAAVFEVPMVQARPESGGYILRIDAATGDRYLRLLIEITLNLQISILSETTIAALPSAQQGNALPGFRPVEHGDDARDSEQLIPVLGETETGRMLIRVFELHTVAVITVPSAKDAFVYDEVADLIIHQRVGSGDVPIEHRALAFALALRFMDQALMGQKLPDPLQDTLKYATNAHGKNLDAIVHVCKIAIQFQQTPRGYEALRYIERAGFLKVFEAVRRDASHEELFDAYASS